MVHERRRPPRLTWLLLACALLADACSFVLRTQTKEVTWYELGLALLGCALVTGAGLLLLPLVIRLLRPSSYQDKSTTGERLLMAGLWVLLVGCLVTLSAGPGWAPPVLLAAGFAGVLLVMRRQKRRIHG